MGLNKRSVVELARSRTPRANVIGKENWFRHDVVRELSGNNNIGIELGVARGIFSKRMIDSGKFRRFYGVDVYGDIHDTREYVLALKHIGLDAPEYTLLRMEFEHAITLFDDEVFDFIYIDGFAHSGEDGGRTLIDWIQKLKVGGILAGDDYHEDWPLVVWAVNHLAKVLGAEVNLTLGVESEVYCQYPTWYLRKEKETFNIEVDPLLYSIGMSEKRRINAQRTGRFGGVRAKIVAALQFFGVKESASTFLSKLEKRTMRK